MPDGSRQQFGGVPRDHPFFVGRDDTDGHTAGGCADAAGEQEGVDAFDRAGQRAGFRYRPIAEQVECQRSLRVDRFDRGKPGALAAENAVVAIGRVPPWIVMNILRRTSGMLQTERPDFCADGSGAMTSRILRIVRP